MVNIQQFISVGVLLAGMGSATAQSIYTCVDANGRRLTSDRPIPECLDRTQRELGSSGATKRTVGPSLTAEEVAALDLKQRQQADEARRQDEERRRLKALIDRYPNPSALARDRAATLAQVDEAVAAGAARLRELETERLALVKQIEAHSKTGARTPQNLLVQVNENFSHISTQKRLIADQHEQKRRINARFDEQLALLKPLWLVP